MVKRMFAGILAMFLFSCGAMAQGPGALEGDKDVSFAMKFWPVLENAKLVGKNRIHSQPSKAILPVGGIRQIIGTDVKVDGRTARVLVKINYEGEGISVESVYDNPNKYLVGYTVMFKREDGYDDENKNWFWAKYDTKGELNMNSQGAKIAGRAEKLCIACHTTMGGDDLEVLTQK